MKIRDVVLLEIRGRGDPGSFPVGDRQANQLDIYPEFNAQDWTKKRVEGVRELRAVYVEIQTDAGPAGIFGPIEEEQAFVIHRFLRPFLIGRDPLATEALYDQMLRLNRHGRSGMFMTGVSPVDCALWDLKGKAWEQPLYRLLGGPTRPAVPAYASMLGFATDPEAAVVVARQYQSMGYQAQKWFFRYGPGDGESGKTRNVALVQALRDALGPHYMLMVDAFMGWDASYTAEMMRLLEPFNLAWLEEPIPPERVGAFSRLKSAGKTPLATGEHVYTRWQVKELLTAGAVDWIQTDPDWTGGVTELVKICALGSAFETPVVAHGHSLLAALHVAGSQSPSTVPMVEYLVQYQPEKQFFHKPAYEPVEGSVALPELPGLGIVIDEDKVDSKIELFNVV